MREARSSSTEQTGKKCTCNEASFVSQLVQTGSEREEDRRKASHG